MVYTFEDNYTKMDIGEVLAEIRDRRGLKQVDVARRLKTTQANLSRIENNKTQPTKAMIKRLCKVYKVPPNIPMIMAMQEKDVPKENRELFNQLKPIIDTMIDQLLPPTKKI